MFGHRPRLAHSHQGAHQHPLRRQAWITIGVAMLLAIIALLLVPPHAHGNFVYWANAQNPNGSIGRAKINGSGLNDNFIPNLQGPSAVAIDSQHIYWVETDGGRIGRANLDGSGVISNLLTVPPGTNGIAVNSTGIYYATGGPPAGIGHADLNGGNQNNAFINPNALQICGLAANDSFVYYLDSSNNHIGRAPAGGGTGDDTFIGIPDHTCGLAADPSFLYWSGGNKELGRAPVGGGSADPGFIPNATPTSLFGGPTGVAVNSQYVFWSDGSHAPGTNLIGRANIGGGAPNPALIGNVARPNQMSAAPSNKITVNSIRKKKKKGTATINAKVPGPGQVTLNQVSTPPDVNATAASVKQVGLTITQASSFKLPVKPKGKTAKKLKKQVKKKGKGKVKVRVFIHFVPAGVAGVPNTKQLTIGLVKKGKKKK